MAQSSRICSYERRWIHAYMRYGGHKAWPSCLEFAQMSDGVFILGHVIGFFFQNLNFGGPQKGLKRPKLTKI